MNGNGIEFADALGIVSLIVGLQNMAENRQQSEQNDVSAANDRQASYLLEEIGKRLDSQDMTLEAIMKKLEKMEGRLNSDTV